MHSGGHSIVTGPSVSDRLRLAGLAAGRGLGRVRHSIGAPLRLAVNLRAPVPERLVIAPQDIRTTDPTIANDIYGSYFSFEGKVVPFSAQTLKEIEQFKTIYGMTLKASDSHNLKERRK